MIPGTGVAGRYGEGGPATNAQLGGHKYPAQGYVLSLAEIVCETSRALFVEFLIELFGAGGRGVTRDLDYVTSEASFGLSCPNRKVGIRRIIQRRPHP